MYIGIDSASQRHLSRVMLRGYRVACAIDSFPCKVPPSIRYRRTAANSAGEPRHPTKAYLRSALPPNGDRKADFGPQVRADRGASRRQIYIERRGIECNADAVRYTESTAMPECVASPSSLFRSTARLTARATLSAVDVDHPPRHGVCFAFTRVVTAPPAGYP
jgi:hypothetical protein